MEFARRLSRKEWVQTEWRRRVQNFHDQNTSNIDRGNQIAGRKTDFFNHWVKDYQTDLSQTDLNRIKLNWKSGSDGGSVKRAKKQDLQQKIWAVKVINGMKVHASRGCQSCKPRKPQILDHSEIIVGHFENVLIERFKSTDFHQNNDHWRLFSRRKQQRERQTQAPKRSVCTCKFSQFERSFTRPLDVENKEGGRKARRLFCECKGCLVSRQFKREFFGGFLCWTLWKCWMCSLYK